MQALVAAMRLQFALFRNNFAEISFLAYVPLHAIVFMSLVTYSGRTDLAGYAVLAPAIIGVVSMAIVQSGEFVAMDRMNGIFDALISTPSSIAQILLGRATAVTCVALFSIIESWLVAGLLFNTWVGISSPVVFIATMLCTAFATAGATMVLASLFVLSRSARGFQNALSYPLLLLGGAFVPPDLLPTWLQPVTNVIYLSWATDLLRDSIGTASVEYVLTRLLAVLGLGLAMYLLGIWMLRAILRRITANGTVSFA